LLGIDAKRRNKHLHEVGMMIGKEALQQAETRCRLPVPYPCQFCRCVLFHLNSFLSPCGFQALIGGILHKFAQHHKLPCCMCKVDFMSVRHTYLFSKFTDFCQDSFDLCSACNTWYSQSTIRFLPHQLFSFCTAHVKRSMSAHQSK
jgi:hypothetical protein